MTEPVTARIVDLLVDEAWTEHAADRYGAAGAAAARAVEAAAQLDDPVLLVRALYVEGVALSMQGDHGAAFSRFTRVLGLAEDPATRGRLEDPVAAEVVVRAHMGWVQSAQFVGGIPLRALFGVLDGGERYLRAVGRTEWRAGLVLERALTHQALGELDQAVAAAEEALALWGPEGPGYTLASHRVQLGAILLEAGRAAEAEPHYQAVLDDPDADSPYDRTVALVGLAWCALDRDDAAAARRHALAAVRDAESLGDEALRTPLDVLVEAHRAAAELDDAADVAARYLEVAGRLGGHHNLYYATRAALDVALDRGDRDSAHRLVADLDSHAHARDADTGTAQWDADVAERRGRLDELDAAP